MVGALVSCAPRICVYIYIYICIFIFILQRYDYRYRQICAYISVINNISLYIYIYITDIEVSPIGNEPCVRVGQQPRSRRMYGGDYSQSGIIN